MNNIFKHLLDKCVLVYLDDILIFSESMEDHLIHLQQVLALLRKHQLYGKLEKCDFAKPSVEFLGHVVSGEGIAVDPHKIDTIKSWPQPRNVHELRSFLGLTNYYRKFVK